MSDFEYCSNTDLAEVAETISAFKHVTVTTHAKPDGDAFGSVVALTAALGKRGHDVTAWIAGPLGESLEQMRGAEMVRRFNADSRFDRSGLIVVLDAGAKAQLDPMVEQIKPHLSQTLIIDHHLSGDLDARWRHIDGSAAACCELVMQLLDEMAAELDGRVICEALFVGITADTGWFRFSNTRPQTHEMAARLLRCGVDHAQLYAKQEQMERPQKLSLMTRALDGLQLLSDCRVAVMVLRAQDFTETGAVISETEQFVDIPQIVASVQTVVLISEPPRSGEGPPQAIRISFRSKPGPGAVNVADLAAKVGGGGHARAAGAKMEGPLDEVVDRVINLLLTASAT